MYCRNCGKAVSEKAEICPQCGVRPLLEKKFCQECGTETRENQELCVKCGVWLKTAGAGEAAHLDYFQLMRIYDPLTDIEKIPASQREDFKKHTLLETFPLVLVVLFHFLTLGIFTTIYFGVKHSKLPLIRPDDFKSGKAIGFLFIPFFNLYWIFVFWIRLVDRINFQFKLRNQTPPISRGLAITACVFLLVPYIGWLIDIFLFPILTVQIQSACNVLATVSGPAGESQYSAQDVRGLLLASKRKTTIAAIVVGIIAVFFFFMFTASLSIPNIVISAQKAKQRGTTEYMTSLSTAIIDYIVDNGTTPDQNGIYDENSDFFKALSPIYVRKLPLKDLWGNNFYVYCGEACEGKYGISGAAKDDFIIVSHGKDGQADSWFYNNESPESGLFFNRLLKDFKNDLIMWNGSWIRAPLNERRY